MVRLRRIGTGLAALAALIALAACASGSGTTSWVTFPATGAAPSSAPAPSATPTPAPTPAPTAAATPPAPSPSPQPVELLTLEQRVGQLFIVGTSATAADPVALDALARLQVGGVFLHGRSHAGVAATAALTGQLRAASTSPVPLLVATDQEGGQVQVLNGPGFTDLPSAVVQGGMAPPDLQAAATGWGASWPPRGSR